MSSLPPPPPPPEDHGDDVPPPPPPPPVYDAGAEPTGPGRYTAFDVPPSPPRPADVAGRLVFLVGLIVTLGLVGALVAAWPADAGPKAVDDTTPTTLMTAEVAEQLGSPTVGGFETPEQEVLPSVQLFSVGPEGAVDDVMAAAGRPTQLHGLAIYPTYLFVEYVDGDRIDRRLWRDTEVGDAEPTPIDSRVDAKTTPELFTLDELDLALKLLPSMVQDAPTHYDVATEVTHVLIDRFLPFDDRVLVRVYASPPDDPTGGGYVTYTTAGVFQKVCC